MTETLLEVSDLGVTFARGDVRAVKGVSLTVAPGERVGLVGESGSGKSTTALSILRLHDEDAVRYDDGAAIRYRGEDVLTMSPRPLTALRGAKISMVFQDPLASLNPVVKAGHQVRDVIAAHLRLRRAECRDRTLQALRDAGIPDAERVYRSYPFQLSGGLRQRVVIAMAIGCGPDLLVADEPTSALDATVQAEVLRTFSRLCAERSMGLLLISHDIGVIAHMCDRVYVMYQGEVVEHGPTRDVIVAPTHAYTRTLIASALYREREVALPS